MKNFLQSMLIVLMMFAAFIALVMVVGCSTEKPSEKPAPKFVNIPEEPKPIAKPKPSFDTPLTPIAIAPKQEHTKVEGHCLTIPLL